MARGEKPETPTFALMISIRHSPSSINRPRSDQTQHPIGNPVPLVAHDRHLPAGRPQIGELLKTDIPANPYRHRTTYSDSPSDSCDQPGNLLDAILSDTPEVSKRPPDTQAIHRIRLSYEPHLKFAIIVASNRSHRQRLRDDRRTKKYPNGYHIAHTNRKEIEKNNLIPPSTDTSTPPE